MAERGRRLCKKYWRFKGTADLDFMTASYGEESAGCHFHHGFTISVVAHGALPLSFKECRIDLRPGEILLLGPEVPHAFDRSQNTGECLYRTLTHTGTNIPLWLEKMLSRERNSICRIRSQSLWGHLLASIEKTKAGEEREFRTVDALTTDILSDIARYVVHKFEVRSPSIRRIKDYLDTYYSRAPDIEELSRTGGLSPRYFLRLFKEEIGMTPHRYLNQLRVNNAKQRLGGGQSMLHIAHELGFADQSHFSKTFSKMTGVSPAKYVHGIGIERR